MYKGTLSIIIPAFNEAQRISVTLRSIERYFKKVDAHFEIIVVDDGSVDSTVEMVRRMKTKIKRLKVLVNEENKGKGYSVARGMLTAKGKYRLFMDADNSVDIKHLGKFMKEIDKGHDVVIGSIHLSKGKQVEEHNGMHRRILGSFANLLIQIFAVWGIKDTQRGFKLFTSRAAIMIFSQQTINRFGFDIEALLIARNCGFSIKELPVVWRNPAGSKVTSLSYVQTLIELARITLNRLSGKYGIPTVQPKETYLT